DRIKPNHRIYYIMAKRVFEDEIPADKIEMTFGLVQSGWDDPPPYMVPGKSWREFLFLALFFSILFFLPSSFFFIIIFQKGLLPSRDKTADARHHSTGVRKMVDIVFEWDVKKYPPTN